MSKTEQRRLRATRYELKSKSFDKNQLINQSTARFFAALFNTFNKSSKNNRAHSYHITRLFLVIKHDDYYQYYLSCILELQIVSKNIREN